MRLWVRFALVISALLLVGQGFYSAAYYYLQGRTELSEAYRQASESLRLAASVCHEAALTGDWEPARQHYQELLRADGSTRYAECRDRDGRPLLFVSAHGDAPAEAARAAVGVFTVSRGLPLPADGASLGAARIGYDAVAIHRRVRRRLLTALRDMALVGSASLLLGLAAALLVARTLTRPVSALAEAAREVGSGNLEYRLPEDGRDDELGALRARFNDMAARLSELDALRHRFLAAFTHDLKSPLAGIRGCLENLRDGAAGALSEAQRARVGSALEAAARVWGALDEMLALTALRDERFPVRLAPLSARDAVREAVEAHRPRAQDAAVRLSAELPARLPRVKADPELLRRLLDNLLANALNFTPAGGSIRVRARRSGRFVRVEVADTGPGIPAAELVRVFESYHRVDGARGLARARGTGLGLAICKGIVREHGGRIWAESPPGRGARILFTLPRA